MNIYDKTHELAKALKNSSEYKNLAAAQQSLNEDETAKKMVKDFLSKRMELETLAFTGKEDKEKEEQLRKLYELINLNPKAGTYINAHMRLMQIMNDVYKIIGESFSEISAMDMFDEK
ncbi:MAG: YlbF family regulator [Sporomusaceae bacterium]|nr:YlbF family regulator [Sporomusaceae bacterium]